MLKGKWNWFAKSPNKNQTPYYQSHFLHFRNQKTIFFYPYTNLFIVPAFDRGKKEM